MCNPLKRVSLLNGSTCSGERYISAQILTLIHWRQTFYTCNLLIPLPFKITHCTMLHYIYSPVLNISLILTDLYPQFLYWSQAWRVYQRGLERWLSGLLQPLFDNLVANGKVPTFVLRLRILDLTFDHEAPCLSNMRRRTSRKDSDLNAVVDVRYTGGARMLLMLEVGGGQWRLQVVFSIYNSAELTFYPGKCFQKK